MAICLILLHYPAYHSAIFARHIDAIPIKISM